MHLLIYVKEFITGDTSAVAEWAAEDTNDYVVLSMRLQQPAPFTEIHQFAQDGTAYYCLKKVRQFYDHNCSLVMSALDLLRKVVPRLLGQSERIRSSAGPQLTKLLWETTRIPCFAQSAHLGSK